MSILTQFSEGAGSKIAADGPTWGKVTSVRWGMNDFKGQVAPKPGLFVLAVDPDTGEALLPFEEFLGM